MSEYWVSRDKFYCKYCNVYIADDKPSRLHHDTGLRHKGNYERFIRDIYKKGEKDRKDKAEEAKELSRMEAAANAAMAAEDLAAGRAPIPSTSSLPPPSDAPRKKPAASSDPYANYSTAESLGYVDPDAAEKASAKAEAEGRQNEGMIGEWKSVKVPPRTVQSRNKEEVKAEEEEEEKEKERIERLEERPSGGKWLKEKVRALDEEEFDPSLIGNFKLKRQRMTLKEEEEVRLEEEGKERIRKEREKEVRRLKRERERSGASNTWAEVDVDEEEEGDFVPWADPNEVKEEDDEEEKPDKVEGDQTIPKVEEEEEKPKVAERPKEASGGGFKKRKMFGAAAARKKVA